MSHKLFFYLRAIIDIVVFETNVISYPRVYLSKDCIKYSPKKNKIVDGKRFKKGKKKTLDGCKWNARQTCSFQNLPLDVSVVFKMASFARKALLFEKKPLKGQRPRKC